MATPDFHVDKDLLVLTEASNTLSIAQIKNQHGIGTMEEVEQAEADVQQILNSNSSDYENE